MIHTEIVTIEGRQYKHTWSDTNTIMRSDGVEYYEAYDPVDTDRKYSETKNIKPQIK